ncbi:Wzz/FepE/Etk N-terminal domain-containing protein [Vibrio sp.]|nr:Wzz/FepE/Etk N-terminal domain-containing protein [Vibrio sp.]
MTEPMKQLPPDAHFSASNDEIDLRELFGAIWKGKWIIILSTIIFAAGAVFYALKQPNIYKAYAVLSPAQSSGGGGLSQLAGQFGGLAAIAGVNLGGAESSQTDLAVQVMTSRKFIEGFVNKHELIVPIMAVNNWDITTNELIINTELYDEDNNIWLREAKGLRQAKPSAQEIYEAFTKNNLVINQDKESGLYTIAISHFSPYVAQEWVNLLIKEINSEMRKRTLIETQKNLGYLENQLERTPIAEMQTTFYALIEEQTKSLMLAEVQEEFVFKVVDPAVVPEQKDKPKRALIVILGTLLGGMLGVAIVLVRFAFKREKNEEPPQ